MLNRVKDDGGQLNLGRYCRAALMTAVAIASVLVIQTPVVGQSGEGSSFSAKVTDLSDQTERILVPLFASVTVETTEEVIRADVVARRIADVQILSPTRVLITGEAFGYTTIVLTGKSGGQHVFGVNVELNLTRLNETIRQIDPFSSAKASTMRGNIVLMGSVTSAERATRIEDMARMFLPPSDPGRQATEILNMLDVVGEQQVLLRCVVAEVNRSSVRELGINGFLTGDNFKDAFVVNQIGGINPIDLGLAGNALVTSNIPFLTADDGNALLETTTLALGFPRVQLELFIRAMADNSLLQILAEPNLVTISGETATFLAGGEFPIPVPQGDETQTIEFRQFGVRLSFAPVVRGPDRIRLRVVSEVSELDLSTAVQLGGFVVPGLSTRSVDTTVELAPGQTIAIAGLLNEQVRALATRLPGLGNVPVLGALFRSVSYRRALTELVILVTPEIVAPMDGHQKPDLPTDDSTPPTDSELYLLGLVEGGSREASSGSQIIDVTVTSLPSQPDEYSVHGPWGHAGRLDG